MNRIRLTSSFAAVLWHAAAPQTIAADTSTVTYPYLGITHIARVGSSPDFPRNVKMHIVEIDLRAPSLSFKFTPHAGTRDTLRQTTLQFLQDQGAQLAINGSFFLPFPSPDRNSALVGFAASNGDVYSPFERPKQDFAIVRDSPAINIDHRNNVSIVHRDPAFSDGTCYSSCQSVDGLHVLENVELWNAFSGSAQIVTGGAKTIPCYADATHPDCGLIVAGPGARYSNSHSWYDQLKARTSIGFTCDRKTLVLFTVDATNGSSGMTVGEVADVLIRDYGVCDALNMDGGGSTSLAMVDPATGIAAFVNSSSDNPNGRANASGLAVFAARDTQPPRTRVQVSPAPETHRGNNAGVVVTLTAQDNPGGIVKQIEYLLSGATSLAAKIVAGDTASFTVSADGITSISFFATDVAGNREPCRSLPVSMNSTLAVTGRQPVYGLNRSVGDH